MSTAAVIVAAGRGLRAGGELAKQWRPLAGRRMIDHTVAAFRASPVIDRIVLVLAPGDEAHAADLAGDDLIIAEGGDDRAASVHRGLRALAGTGTERVLIHDAARPCASPALIGAVAEAVGPGRGAAPALAVSDALWTGEAGRVSGTLERAGLFRAQTPQGFVYDEICAAHASHPGGAADDVEVARAAGLDVVIVPGDPDNLKVTLPQDFARAARILGGKMSVRLGNGFDVHRFGDGDHVTLCGVRIPHPHGLAGHSDADVGMHAVTDAIYGALAAGDIGQHFPPSDPRWKGANSEIFLAHAAAMAAERGFRVAHVDCTLICEAPRIGPHVPAMRAALAGIIGVPEGDVSVKATTSEGLGFTGRGEGIAAMATATLVPS